MIAHVWNGSNSLTLDPVCGVDSDSVVKEVTMTLNS